MTKELEALQEIKDYIEDNITTKYNHVEYEIKFIENALKRLEAIDSSKPSEALKLIDEITSPIIQANSFRGNNKSSQLIEYIKKTITIKQALLKAQEQEIVLEIIKEKSVDMIELGCAKYYHQYNKEVYEKYHTDDMLLTEEEFELLKRYFDEH